MNTNVDWTQTMQRTFEYYIVDPGTWHDIRKLEFVKSSNIEWDEETDTLGSATFEMNENIGEHYIRIYMIIIQNGVKQRRDLGVFLVQSPSLTFDGKVSNTMLDAYSPLLELNEKKLPIGYFIPKGTNIMAMAYRLAREGARAPVISTTCSEVLHSDFVADTGDTYLGFIRDLISNAKYMLTVDERGRILFTPKRELAALQPVMTFNDDNSSILLPDISIEEDIYGIPNVVNIVCTREDGEVINVTVKNEDNSSPTSIQSRGREIMYREVDPTLLGDPTKERVEEYATQMLKKLSSIERSITFSHGYCPVRIGDCVRLNYTRAELVNVKAKIIRQSISCTPECTVTETAVYTRKYWR